MSDNDSPDESQNEDNEAAGTESVQSLVSSLSFRDTVTAVMVVALVISLVGVVGVALTPQQSASPFTEFYVLSEDSNASDYPTNLTVGEEATVTVGIVNRENRRMTYTLAVRVNNNTLETRTVTVDRGQQVEEAVSYSVNRLGPVKIRFLLYRGSNPDVNSEPYQNLRLWTNVSKQESDDS